MVAVTSQLNKPVDNRENIRLIVRGVWSTKGRFSELEWTKIEAFEEEDEIIVPFECIARILGFQKYLEV